MANSILVDTDILIDAARNVENAITRLDSEGKDAILSISKITQMELIVGCRNKKELQNLENFLNRFEIISLNEDIADTAVALLRRYRLSHGLLIPDSLIASSAITCAIPLLSKNLKDYRFIEKLN